MDQSQRGHRIRVMGCAVAMSLLFLASTAMAQNPADPFLNLKSRLIKDGFTAADINRIYQRPGVAFDVNGVSLYFVHQEGKLNYDQFAEKDPINKARNYAKQHAASLKSAVVKYGVDSEVIVAILLVESRLGTFSGNRSVLNSLSTMAALSDATVREMFWNKIAGATRLTKNEYESKAQGKSNWAYNELKAFLEYALKEKLEAEKIMGSYAGAMGYCQFMPSNIQKLARDGDGDQRINLFTHPDAIMSIASYLAHYGWTPGLGREKAAKVIYHYNHSVYYVNAILKIMELLKNPS